MKRIGVALLSGVAALSLSGAVAPAVASGVTVNLDALGKPDAAKPEPVKKPVVNSPPTRPDAVRSEVVPDDEVETTPRPAPAAKPKVSEKPAVRPAPPKPAVKSAAPKKPAAAAQGEIDFIAKTKRKEGASAAPVEAAAPAAAPVQAAPLSLPADIALDPALATSAPAAMALPAAPPAKTAAPKPVTPKPQPTPATVKVDTGALDAASGAGGPAGTPLTSIAPDGALFIPKNVDALPKPVSVPATAQPQSEPEEASEPLTLPPILPEAPAPAVAAPAPASVAAVAPAAAPAAAVAAASPALARASVLAGYATATELKFDAGQDALTPDAQASLDQLAQSLKAAGMRVQLAAYSGPPGNNSSDARRLSLKRALAVREYLAGQGVQKLMVNIVALGGPATGATDRVDVMVRADQLSRAAGQ